MARPAARRAKTLMGMATTARATTEARAGTAGMVTGMAMAGSTADRAGAADRGGRLAVSAPPQLPPDPVLSQYQTPKASPGPNTTAATM